MQLIRFTRGSSSIGFDKESLVPLTPSGGQQKLDFHYFFTFLFLTASLRLRDSRTMEENYHGKFS